MKPIPKEKCEKPIETPRTDLAKEQILYSHVNTLGQDNRLDDMTEHARQLEREVIQLREALNRIDQSCEIDVKYGTHSIQHIRAIIKSAHDLRT